MSGSKSIVSILMGLNLMIGVPLVDSRGIGDYYWKSRAALLQAEENIAFGGDLNLGEDEILANDTLMSAKFKEIDEGSFKFYNIIKNIKNNNRFLGGKRALPLTQNKYL